MDVKEIPKKDSLNRRQFITGAGAGVMVMRSELVRGSKVNSKVSVGMIGCGHRGVFVAERMEKHGGYQLVSAADYFQERVDSYGERFQLPGENRYAGLSSYKRLLEKKVDAIGVETPPYFHPEQVEAAVDAGAHIYLAKPMAVDVPGCKSIAESARKAAEKNLSFLVDFQTRADPLYQEAVKRAQYGDIGRIICGEAIYVADFPFAAHMPYLQADPKNPEAILRAWGVSRALSGDIITEQNIHALDVATWILDADPVKAVGTGGRKSRDLGDCWDHFSVIFTFPRDVIVTFNSKQFGAGMDDICCRMYGTDGTIDTHYSADVAIRGKVPYRGGKAENLYHNGAVWNIETFHEDVTKGTHAHTTVAPSVRSNLTTILGRMAAYSGREVTWDQMIKSSEKLEIDLKGLKV
jgi:myo-inositol 2-dehydrogenase / D-chiro-inositol 1-dehydrogenase